MTLIAMQGAMMAGQAGPPPATVTWNPADTSGLITLSGGDLVATRNLGSNSYGSTRANVGKSSGKWYWEVLVGAGNATPYIMIGAGRAAASLSTYPGDNANSWGYYEENGSIYYNSSYGPHGPSYLQGDVIQVALDMDAGRLFFGKNGTFVGDPVAGTGAAFSGVSGTVFPMVGLWRGDSGPHQVTGRFDSGSWTHSAPAGYAALS